MKTTILDSKGAADLLAYRKFKDLRQEMTPREYNLEYGHHWDPSDFGLDDMETLCDRVVIHNYMEGYHIIEYKGDSFELPLEDDAVYGDRLFHLEKLLYQRYAQAE